MAEILAFFVCLFVFSKLKLVIRIRPFGQDFLWHADMFFITALVKEPLQKTILLSMAQDNSFPTFGYQVSGDASIIIYSVVP